MTSSIEHFHEGIEGWFDWEELYRDWVEDVPDGGVIVEVGAYKGKSTAYLGVEAARVLDADGKRLQIHVVDTWQGSAEHARDAAVQAGTLYADYQANVAPVAHLLRNHRDRSTTAATRFPAGSVDRVYIDAAHDYDSVSADLDAWWPTVAPGGQMAGHDYDWPSVRDAVEDWADRRGYIVQHLAPRTWVIQKPVVRRDWTVAHGERSLSIQVVSSIPFTDAHTTETLARLMLTAERQAAVHGFTRVGFGWQRGSVHVDVMRDDAVREALAGEFTHLLFIDADMTLPEDTLDRLLVHADKGVIGGLYVQKVPEYKPVGYVRTVNRPGSPCPGWIADERLIAPGATGLRRVDALGMGCTLIPTALFTQYERPWFAYQEDAKGRRGATEDIWFCQQAVRLGCLLWINTDLQCGHRGVFTSGVRTARAMQLARGAGREHGRPSPSRRADQCDAVADAEQPPVEVPPRGSFSNPWPVERSSGW